MLKTLWFQLHWLLGITAGIVLAVVGVTGGMLSFEDEILRALNPGVITVTPQPSGLLPPDVLLQKVRANAPERTITALTVYADPENAARVTFAPPPGAPSGPRGETRYVHPYDGTLLGAVRGQDFFRFTMQVHRWLAAGEFGNQDAGKQIVGASTVALVVLSLTGLYLRWPRRPLRWGAWLRLDAGKRGRAFLWDLHSVIGTWVLPFYLLASLTGLYWSYDWYRNALFDLTGTPRPAQQQGPRPAGPPAAPGERARGADGQRPQAGQGGPDIAKLWSVFQREAGPFSMATLRLSPGNQPLTITYQPPNPAHERANNTLVIEPSGAVRQHRRFDELPTGQRLMGSIFPLHAGSYFGWPGLILMMIASLLMPLFTITGWMLYLDRRKKKGEARRAATLSAPAGTGEPVLVAFASQTGTAERLAFQTAAALQAAGTPARVVSLARLTPDTLAQVKQALFIVSTFGDGEPPDAARPFARAMARFDQKLDHVAFGLLALGDSTYAGYCGFGRDLESWLTRAGARPLFAAIEVDAEAPAALKTWQDRLSALTGAAVSADWSGPAFSTWRLTERRCLNPGSVGLATFHVVLEPSQPELLTDGGWQAGDIAQVRPRNDPGLVRRRLAALSLDPAAPVAHAGADGVLEGLAQRGALPEQVPDGITAQQFADLIRPLPERDYSIASIPEDGRLELVIRQARTPEGEYGIGSGWLTTHAQPGAEIELRIRANPAFHLPEGDMPLILIGNGTGIAGLRSHLKARIHGGHDRNWLIFGERNAAHDFYFRDEINGWLASGGLARLDLAFSRDQEARLYVQHRLLTAAREVRDWVEDGAVLLVCGSLQGMAEDVDKTLREILGAERLEALAAEGRYRRDVY